MDSLRVTTQTFASMGIIIFEILPILLTICIGILQILYLIKKLKEK